MTDNPGDSQDSGRWTWQFVVTVGLLLLFAAVVFWLMIAADNTEETVWQRRVYLFGAVQAIVFTAVGWLFGREVNRSAVEAGKEAAADAKKEAADARTEAGVKAEEAAAAQQAAVAERTKGEVVAAVVAHSQPAGRPQSFSTDAAAGDEEHAVVDLQGLLRDLYRR